MVEATLDQERLRALSEGLRSSRAGSADARRGAARSGGAAGMLPFGHAYAEHGAGVLRLLLCASVFRAVIALFSAVSRVQGRGLRLAWSSLPCWCSCLAPDPAGDADGIEGVGAAWLGANAIDLPGGAPVAESLSTKVLMRVSATSR